MASKKKTLKKTTAKKKTKKKKAVGKRRRGPISYVAIHVNYNVRNGTVNIIEPDVKFHKGETLIQWVKADGSDDFIFSLGVLHSPFGTPTLEDNDTVIELKYHGKPSDDDMDFAYKLESVARGNVQMSKLHRFRGGATIRNH